MNHIHLAPSISHNESQQVGSGLHSGGGVSPLDMTSSNHLISFIFGIILPLVFIVFGTTGNLLSIAVLHRLKQRTHRASLFVILIGLAVADSLLLLCTLLVNVLPNAFRFVKSTGWWLLYEPYRTEGYIVVSCWPFSLAFQMASIYCTMLVSYERWMAVCKPLRVSHSRAISHIYTTIVVLFLACLAYNIPRFFEYGVVEKPLQRPDMSWEAWRMRCATANSTHLLPARDAATNTTSPAPCLLTKFSFEKTSFGNKEAYRFVYAATLYSLCHFVVPVAFITWSNVELVRTLRRRRHVWTAITRSQRKEIRLTYVPLAIVCLFYFLGLPAVLVNIIDSVNYATENGDLEAWLTVANFCVLLNSSVNFIIYCFWGEKFQQTLGEMFGCSRFQLAAAVHLSQEEQRGTRDGRRCTSYRLTTVHYDGPVTLPSPGNSRNPMSLGNKATPCRRHFDLRLNRVVSDNQKAASAEDNFL